MKKFYPKKGRVLGRWKLIKRLKYGGNSVVWLAEDNKKELEGSFAIKIMNEKGWKSEQRIKNEIDVASKLPNGISLPIVDSHLSGKKGDKSYIVMPVAKTLSTWREETKPSVNQKLSALLEIAIAIRDLHAAAYSHRDIKPQNIFLHRGQWLLGDFGLVTGPQLAQPTGEGEVVGARYYVAPEVTNREGDGEGPEIEWTSCDVFSFGQLIWWLFSGQAYPFGVFEYYMFLALHIQRLLEDTPNMNIVDSLVHNCTRYNASDRHDMEEVVAELKKLAKLDQNKMVEKKNDPVDLSSLFSSAKLAEVQNELKDIKTKKILRIMRTLSQDLRDMEKELVIPSGGNLQVSVTDHSNSVGAFQKDAFGHKLEGMNRLSSVIRLLVKLPNQTPYLHGGFDLYWDNSSSTEVVIFSGYFAHADNQNVVFFSLTDRFNLDTCGEGETVEEHIKFVREKKQLAIDEYDKLVKKAVNKK